MKQLLWPRAPERPCPLLPGSPPVPQGERGERPGQPSQPGRATRGHGGIPRQRPPWGCPGARQPTARGTSRGPGQGIPAPAGPTFLPPAGRAEHGFCPLRVSARREQEREKRGYPITQREGAQRRGGGGEAGAAPGRPSLQLLQPG